MTVSGDHEYLGKFKLSQLEVRRFDHWIVAVRAKQVTLGACVILLRRPEPSLGALTAQEAIEMTEVVKWWESEATKLFNPDRFNYVFAMMKDPFVHMHAFPRYGDDRTSLSVQWHDAFWPRAIELQDVTTSEQTLEGLVRSYRGLS